MYEDKTVENIHKELLDDIDDSYDKTEGYLIYDTLKSIAIEEEGIYKEISNVSDKLDVDNLKNEELANFVEQRKGITRNQATHAIGQLTVTGNGTVTIGDLFQTESSIQFEATETKAIIDTGTVNIQCIQAGSIGNVPANRITGIPVTITGIIAVDNTAATYDGFDEESDDSLRERYYIAVRTPPTSGNKYHYLLWSKEISGVGDAKVFPLERGDNTVEVIIIDVNKQPASTELVASVQDYIDPNSSGLGEGEAPIGAKCYVESAVSLEININVSITKLSGYTDDAVKSNIEKDVENYLKAIAFESDFLSYAKLGSVILDSEGVEDYSNLTINSVTSNIPIGSKEVATLGVVTLV
ncbi:baseplate J/gp47 family protein [Wukongibacter sp. M2B1]|uniref:baseplate J/gp47 family protein n=1 Tax=Wukongibacter sp. M2B1 TaxID=3088895 RepID=UPI003D7C0A88